MIDLTNNNINELLIKYSTLLEFFPYEKEKNVFILDVGINYLNTEKDYSLLL